MEIRQDVSARIDHESGARAFDRHRLHEDVIFERARQDVGHGRSSLAVYLDVDGFLAQKLARFRFGERDRHGPDALRLPLAPAAACPVRSQNERQAQGQQTDDAAAAVFSFTHDDVPLKTMCDRAPSSTATLGCAVLWVACAGYKSSHDRKNRTGKSACATKTSNIAGSCISGFPALHPLELGEERNHLRAGVFDRARAIDLFI